MHEAYLAECVLRQTRDSLPATVLPTDVTAVKLRIGQLDAVMPEILSEMFYAFRNNFDLNHAELAIELEPVACRCKDCDAQFGLDSPIFVCPQCFGNRIQVLHGRGLTLTEITLFQEENENSHNS